MAETKKQDLKQDSSGKKHKKGEESTTSTKKSRISPLDDSAQGRLGAKIATQLGVNSEVISPDEDEGKDAQSSQSFSFAGIEKNNEMDKSDDILKGITFVGIKKGSKEYNDLVREIQEEKNAPPLFSDEDGDVDVKDAALFVVDGHSLKKQSVMKYHSLLDFAFDCSRICSLRLFTHPGCPGDSGLISVEGKKLEDNSFKIEIARRAITEYNRISKCAKLKLGKLMKVNSAWWCAMVSYMTFSAIEEDTGKVGTYQAAVRETESDFVLGLFRDCDNDKILAIISVTGAEEDLAAKKKIVAFARRKKRC